MPTAVTTPVHQASLLVVEDSPVNQRLLCGLLEREGYRILTADNGRAAMELLRIELPDLILLDILMPEINGLDVCRLLKRTEATQDIPVIFISALEDTADKLMGFEVGGVDYITKPFHPAEVLARVDTHLKLRGLRFQLEEKNRQLELERSKSEALLRNVLPARVARELMDQGHCTPQCFADVSVGFVDIVQFTAAAARLTPEHLIGELNALFTTLDRITDAHGCERMKTIGDAFLFVCGMPEETAHHTRAMATAALEMLATLKERNQANTQQWQVRIGLHSGPVVGGVVGTKKYIYDIFGDTVNIASRLEEVAPPMRICVSEAMRDRLWNEFLLTGPELTQIRGKGNQNIYFLEGWRQG